MYTKNKASLVSTSDTAKGDPMTGWCECITEQVTGSFFFMKEKPQRSTPHLLHQPTAIRHRFI